MGDLIAEGRFDSKIQVISGNLMAYLAWIASSKRGGAEVAKANAEGIDGT